MEDKRRREALESIAEAACRYRDAMRRYLAEQVEAIDRGDSLDELLTVNWQHYTEATQKEEDLFALLDAFCAGDID
jgi:hypothetical protein